MVAGVIVVWQLWVGPLLQFYTRFSPLKLYILQCEIICYQVSQNTEKTFHVVSGTAPWMFYGYFFQQIVTMSPLSPFDVS